MAMCGISGDDQLINSGKCTKIIRQYEKRPASCYQWVKQSGVFTCYHHHHTAHAPRSSLKSSHLPVIAAADCESRRLSRPLSASVTPALCLVHTGEIGSSLLWWEVRKYHTFGTHRIDLAYYSDEFVNITHLAHNV